MQSLPNILFTPEMIQEEMEQLQYEMQTKMQGVFNSYDYLGTANPNARPNMFGASTHVAPTFRPIERNTPISAFPFYDNVQTNNSTNPSDPNNFQLPTFLQTDLSEEGKNHRDNEAPRLKRQSLEHKNKSYGLVDIYEPYRKQIRSDGTVIEASLDGKDFYKTLLPSGTVWQYHPNTRYISKIMCANGQIITPDFDNIPISYNPQTPLETDQIIAYHEAGHTILTLKFPSMFAINKICIQKTTSDGSTTLGYNSLTNIQAQGIWKPMTLLYCGGAAAQQILANQGKISKEQIFSGIDDDYTNGIEKN